MSTFSEIVYGFGVVLRLFALFIVIGQICFCVNAFLHRHAIAYRFLAILQSFVGAFWLFVLLDGSFNKDYVTRPRSYIAAVELIYDAPWIIVFIVDLLMAAVCCLSLYRDDRYRRTHLSRSAIKETVDKLPAGLCFAREDGVVVLKNQQMEELCTALCGRSLLDAGAFRHALEERGEVQDQARIVTLPDGRTMLFREEAITVDGAPFLQLSAYDVSERYQITAELKAKNKKLMELQQRMKVFDTQTAALSVNEEILKARVTVHDEMGHLLIIGRNYQEHPAETDEEKLIQAQRYVHLLLIHEGEERARSGKNCIEVAMDAARTLGVTVYITGDVPTDGTACELIGRAIRECAANAVKHSDGDSILLAIDTGKDCMKVKLSTNGRAPREPITEQGGLLNLRRSVENAGGKMTVTCDPGVTVSLTL